MEANHEKWSKEHEKLKSLSLGGKIEYLWMYYKIWLVIGAFVIAGIYTAVTMYHGMKENVIVNVAIVGGSKQDTKELEQKFKDYAKVDGKYDVVRIRANIPADGGGITSKTALTTLIGANAVDVLVCPEDIYKEYDQQGGFERTVLLEKDDFLDKMVGIPYENAYAGILVNAQNKKEAALFIEFLSSAHPADAG